MKVDTEDLSEHWADALSIRIQLPLPSEPSDFDTSDEESAAESPTVSPRKSKSTRSSTAGPMALRHLPDSAPIILFTPYLVPAGLESTGSGGSQRGDPFESLGRELAKHHPNISHVPYVPGIGFTEAHETFVVESVCVITVVCEPQHPEKKESMMQQYDFAEKAWNEFMSLFDNERIEGDFVLVQCASDRARRLAPIRFDNVISISSYGSRSAALLADKIFGND